MITSESPELRSAYKQCAEVTRQSARNFYYGLRLLPDPKRSALFTVYAWMRLVDDIADDQHLDVAAARCRLEDVRQRTNQLFEGNVEEPSGMWLALADTVEKYALEPDPFEHMIDGQLEDLEHRGYEMFEELQQYCYRVASTVGLICISIWGYTDASARDLAIRQGIAFQLTNILRDFRSDHENGRLYLPRSDFEAAGLTLDDLLSWSDDAACSAFVRLQTDRAASCYRESEGLAQLISPDCRATLTTMVGIYRGLLNRIIDDPQRIISDQPTRLSAFSKISIALRARLASTLGSDAK